MTTQTIERKARASQAIYSPNVGASQQTHRSSGLVVMILSLEDPPLARCDMLFGVDVSLPSQYANKHILQTVTLVQIQPRAKFFVHLAFCNTPMVVALKYKHGHTQLSARRRKL